MTTLLIILALFTVTVGVTYTLLAWLMPILEQIHVDSLDWDEKTRDR